MISRKSPARLAFLAAVPFALVAASCGGDDGDGAASFDFTMEALDDDGITGSATLSQDGDQVSGTIELSGFEPNTAHAMHLHGEAEGDFGCAEEEQTSNHLIDFPDLVADDEGNVSAEVSIEADEGTLRSGTYVMVHAVGIGETLEAEDGAMDDMDMEDMDDMDMEDMEDMDDMDMEDMDDMDMEDMDHEDMEDMDMEDMDHEDMDMEMDEMDDMEEVEDDGHDHVHGTNPGVTCGEAA